MAADRNCRGGNHKGPSTALHGTRWVHAGISGTDQFCDQRCLSFLDSSPCPKTVLPPPGACQEPRLHLLDRHVHMHAVTRRRPVSGGQRSSAMASDRVHAYGRSFTPPHQRCTETSRLCFALGERVLSAKTNWCRMPMVLVHRVSALKHQRRTVEINLNVIKMDLVSTRHAEFRVVSAGLAACAQGMSQCALRPVCNAVRLRINPRGSKEKAFAHFFFVPCFLSWKFSTADEKMWVIPSGPVLFV